MINASNMNLANSFPAQQTLSEPQIPLSQFYEHTIFPLLLNGKNIIFIGHGAAKALWVLAQLVGEHGKIVAIDTDEAHFFLAQKMFNQSSAELNMQQTNVELHHVRVNQLGALPIFDHQNVDVVMIQDVIHLTPMVGCLFQTCKAVLKTGGELLISGIFSSRQPGFDREAVEQPGLFPAYFETMDRALRVAGFLECRLLASRKIALKQCADSSQYAYQSVRCFQCDFDISAPEEEQVAVYTGTIAESPESVVLDISHCFKKEVPARVCRNTAKILHESRLAPHFKIQAQLHAMTARFCS